MVSSLKNNKLSLDTFQASLKNLPTATHYWVAYSGGLDSHTLLHLMAILSQQRPDIQITAVHIHHGLQKEADLWLEHCRATCLEIDIVLKAIHVDATPKSGQSPEEAARNCRYRAFQKLVKENEILLTAQHQDDQAETVLLQLLRGAGIAGLSAMPELNAFGAGYLARPLLPLTQQALLDYAIEHKLSWVDDPSNLNTRYDRNFLRQSVLPLLKQHWPRLSQTLHRSSQHCAEAHKLLTDLSAELLTSALNPDDNTLSIPAILSLSLPKQRLLIRAWIQQSGFRYPSTHTVNRIINEIIPAREDKTPEVRWPEGQIRRYRNSLYIFKPIPDFDSHTIFNWNGEKPLLLGSNGVLSATSHFGKGICIKQWKRHPITIKFRTGGEGGYLASREGKHSLKKLFQERGIPPWLRNKIPLAYFDSQLAAVADLWVFEPFQGKEGEPTIRLHWQPEPDREWLM